MAKKDIHNLDTYKEDKKAEKAPETPVSVGAVKTPLFFEKHRKLILIGLVVVLIISALATIVLIRNHNKVTSKPGTQVTEQQNSGIQAQKQPNVITKDDITPLKSAISAQTASTSKTVAATNYAKLGGAYLDAGNYSAAIDAYNTSISSEKSKLALSGLVYAYAYSGQTQKAIDTLNVLIDFTKQQNTADTNVDLQKYNTELNRLKQGLDI